MVALENSLGLDEMRNPSAAAFDGSVPVSYTHLVYETIEHWYNVHGTGPAVYAGTLCLKGWRPGKQVTEQEYLAAVTAFEKGDVYKRPPT